MALGIMSDIKTSTNKTSVSLSIEQLFSDLKVNSVKEENMVFEDIKAFNNLLKIRQIVNESLQDKKSINSNTIKMANVSVDSICKQLKLEQRPFPVFESSTIHEVNVAQLKIASEGITDTLKNIWNRITEKLKNMFNSVVDFFSSLEKVATRVTEAYKELEDVIKNIPSNAKAVQTSIESNSARAFNIQEKASYNNACVMAYFGSRICIDAPEFALESVGIIEDLLNAKKDDKSTIYAMIANYNLRFKEVIIKRSEKYSMETAKQQNAYYYGHFPFGRILRIDVPEKEKNMDLLNVIMFKKYPGKNGMQIVMPKDKKELETLFGYGNLLNKEMLKYAQSKDEIKAQLKTLNKIYSEWLDDSSQYINSNFDKFADHMIGGDMAEKMMKIYKKLILDIPEESISISKHLLTFIKESINNLK